MRPKCRESNVFNTTSQIWDQSQPKEHQSSVRKSRWTSETESWCHSWWVRPVHSNA